MALKQFKMKKKKHTRKASTKRIGLLCQKISFFCYIIRLKQIDIQSNSYFVITKSCKCGNDFLCDGVYALESEFYS
jgi:hypothetical protein